MFSNSKKHASPASIGAPNKQGHIISLNQTMHFFKGHITEKMNIHLRSRLRHCLIFSWAIFHMTPKPKFFKHDHFKQERLSIILSFLGIYLPKHYSSNWPSSTDPPPSCFGKKYHCSSESWTGPWQLVNWIIFSPKMDRGKNPTDFGRSGEIKQFSILVFLLNINICDYMCIYIYIVIPKSLVRSAIGWVNWSNS